MTLHDNLLYRLLHNFAWYHTYSLCTALIGQSCSLITLYEVWRRRNRTRNIDSDSYCSLVDLSRKTTFPFQRFLFCLYPSPEKNTSLFTFFWKSHSFMSRTRPGFLLLQEIIWRCAGQVAILIVIYNPKIGSGQNNISYLFSQSSGGAGCERLREEPPQIQEKQHRQPPQANIRQTTTSLRDDWQVNPANNYFFFNFSTEGKSINWPECIFENTEKLRNLFGICL